MFGLFDSKKKKALEEQRNRAAFFFNTCKEELHTHVLSLREKDTPPTIEQVTRVAVNGKIIYELFKKVKEIGPEAREIGVSLTGQAIDLMSAEYKISGLDAGKMLYVIIDEEISLLQKKEDSDRILGSVKAAYIMATLAGFHEVISS